MSEAVSFNDFDDRFPDKRSVYFDTEAVAGIPEARQVIFQPEGFSVIGPHRFVQAEAEKEAVIE